MELTIHLGDEDNSKVVNSLKEIAEKNSGKLQPKYVNLYLIDRALGGWEEGGWWYDYGIPQQSHIFTPEDGEPEEQFNMRVEYFLEEKEREVKEMNEGRRPISSVLSEGRYWVGEEDAPAESWPKERPYYE
tara:strand:+ start:278 stop:670 length:393 start_codon:yes stop_codon:yes gene_type:complete